MPVVVVTDSSARLGAEDLQRWNIRVLPLHVMCDGVSLRDGVDVIPSDFADRPHATTAALSPGELLDAYRQALADSGGDGVLAVHLSAALSSTYSTALAAGRELGSTVRVVNSRSAAMGVGFMALAAARTAASGADLDSVEAQVRSQVGHQHAFIVVNRLDNLRRSGRIGTAASWLGTALSVKPLLTLDVDGRLVLDQRVRTTAKAYLAMIDRVVELVGERRADIVIHHVQNPDDAAEIGDSLQSLLPHVESVTVSDMGPVLAIHLGAGAVGIVVRC